MDKEQHKHKGECKHDEGLHKGKEEKQKGSSKHQLGKQIGHGHQKADFLQTSISLRKSIHQYPEIGFEEFQTREKIMKILLLFGVQAGQMTKLEPTALVVNLRGRAAPSGSPRCVAFRADMDALTMNENNPELDYRSQVQGKAHMCGHDGHVACLVAFVPRFLDLIDRVPSDKVVRLLFQPSEEGPESGAKKMIEQGCLQGVDEVYGFHNVPIAPVGQFWSKVGTVMSESTVLKIKIIGTGGHGSEPQKTKESIRGAVKFYQRAVDFIDKMTQQGRNFSCSLPVFQGGQRFNVISPDTIIQGTIRSLEANLNKQIIDEFNLYLQDLEKEGFKFQFNYTIMAPLNQNTQAENENVMRVARKVFGDLNVGGEQVLPLKASDDFGFFTQIKPGAYFFLSSSKGEGQGMVHTDTYDFNDDLIDPASRFWQQLIKDRFGVI